MIKAFKRLLHVQVCTIDIEHVLHVFLDYHFAKKCWKISRLDFDTSQVETCSEWMLQRLINEDNEHLVSIATGLWGIWSARNMKVWENKIITHELAVQRSSNLVVQWQSMQQL